MPLGASRVEGARPEFESFRYELWKKIVNGGWEFDYIGTMRDEAVYPEVAGLSFDRDHEGRGGWTSGEILGGINEWLDQTGAPDIVLFSSPGGNDILNGLPLEDAVSNAHAIIDAIQARNPRVIILIEQLAPGRTDLQTQDQIALFNQMQTAAISIAAEQSDAQSTVVAVDMFTGFTDALLADEVHYNEAGATFIADRYYDILLSYLEE